MSTLVTLSVDQIDISDRIRQIDAEQVESLRKSILDIGLLNPITVCSLGDGRYRLVAGAHRLEACRSASIFDITAQVLDLTDLEMIIAECDENLCGTRQLSPADHALFTQRRKEAYEAIYGPSKAIGAHAANESMGRDNATSARDDTWHTP